MKGCETTDQKGYKVGYKGTKLEGVMGRIYLSEKLEGLRYITEEAEGGSEKEG